MFINDKLMEGIASQIFHLGPSRCVMQLQKLCLNILENVSHFFYIKEKLIVGSVKVNFLSYRYRADKSTIFGMRGLLGLTINSGRGAT